jgi:8-oxo-dGTP diphosphatase
MSEDAAGNASDPFHRGAGVLLMHDDAVLLVQRATNRDWAPGAWDVPSGHVETGETEAQAAVQEAREELGVEVELGGDSMMERLTGAVFEIAYFVTRSWTGSPLNAAPAEHTAVRLFEHRELAELEYADRDILPMLYRAFERTTDGR